MPEFMVHMDGQKVAEIGPPQDRCLFIDSGIIEGVQYVDVLDSGHNPMQYGLPLDEARRDYGDHKVITMEQSYSLKESVVPGYIDLWA